MAVAKETGHNDVLPSPKCSWEWDEPMCLVQSTADGCLEIDQKTVDRLREVTVPVVSVSIVGMYRTGKSYLMNILAGKDVNGVGKWKVEV